MQKAADRGACRFPFFLIRGPKEILSLDLHSVRPLICSVETAVEALTATQCSA